MKLSPENTIILATVAAAFGILTYVGTAVLGAHGENRGLVDIVEDENPLVFFRCLGKTVKECQLIMNAAVAIKPHMFPSGINSEVAKRRSKGDRGYFKVGMRTNIEETHVVGALGDGTVSYPFEWCRDSIEIGSECAPIGPWDCKNNIDGGFLNVDECCNMIKSTVPGVDINGNRLECYVDPPVGSLSNPAAAGRARILVAENGMVAHPPRVEAELV